jgi:hypothetical protein
MEVYLEDCSPCFGLAFVEIIVWFIVTMINSLDEFKIEEINMYWAW